MFGKLAFVLGAWKGTHTHTHNAYTRVTGVLAARSETATKKNILFIVLLEIQLNYVFIHVEVSDSIFFRLLIFDCVSVCGCGYLYVEHEHFRAIVIKSQSMRYVRSFTYFFSFS